VVFRSHPFVLYAFAAANVIAALLAIFGKLATRATADRRR
jgi:hypothetical protein